MTIEPTSDLIAGLTARQSEVIERIDRRMPIKQIAQDLGISQSRVNQHIRALKDHFGAESLAELVEIYRAGSEDARLRSADPQSAELIQTRGDRPSGHDTLSAAPVDPSPVRQGAQGQAARSSPVASKLRWLLLGVLALALILFIVVAG